PCLQAREHLRRSDEIARLLGSAYRSVTKLQVSGHRQWSDEVGQMLSIWKSWINDRQFSPAYIKGVKAFMCFVREHCDVNAPIHCPCSGCSNRKHGHTAQVEDHIYIYGMSSTYTRWIYHGEPLIAETNENVEHGIHNPGPMDTNSIDEITTHDYYHDDDSNGDDGIPKLLRDLYTAADKDESHPKFEKILEDAKCALYPGSTKFTKFSFLIKLLHLKSYYRITNTAFDALLQLLSCAFPANNALPRSFNEAKGLLRELGLGYESIDVCVNNCVLFWKDYAKNEHCPVCKESRWRDPRGKNRVAHKVLRYFPLKPRLQRLFMSKETAENTRWHKLKRQVVENETRHPADGEAWKDFDRKYEWFAQDARNLRLGIATDGFNPFGHMSSFYSMWPVFVIPYNLPPWACMDQSNFIMALLILGRKAPGKDFDVFLQPLIQDLLDLWTGTYDVVTDKDFTLHAAVLWCVHDYPALGTLSGRTTKGYFACIHCDEDPLSQALRNKICYLGHRRYLPINHPWRKSRLFIGKYEKRGKPRKFSAMEILKKLEEVKDIRPGKHPLNKKRKRTNKDQPTWHRRVSLWDLPYWAQLKLCHNLDVMHIEKNICENLLWTFLRLEGKTKDTISARLDLEDLGIRKELHLIRNGDSYDRPHACYTMTNDQRVEFCKFLKDVKFPDGYAANLARCVDMDGHKVQHLKTHDCHILLQRVLPAALRGLTRKDIYEVISELAETPIILCKLEKIYPPAFFDVMVHLLVHLTDEALLRGPVQYGWMYPIERRLCTLKRYVRNRARPEGLLLKQTRFNRPGRQNSCQDNGIPQDGLSVFTHGVKLLGASTVSYNDAGYDKLVWYVLNNCPEVDQYKMMFREELERENELNVDQRLEKGPAPLGPPPFALLVKISIAFHRKAPLFPPFPDMPFNKYEEKRLKIIKENVEKMELLGIGPVKSHLDKLSTRKKNAYCIVPSKKTDTEESESTMSPLMMGKLNQKKALRKSPRLGTETSADTFIPEERSAPRVQGSANTNGNIQQRSVGGVQGIVRAVNTNVPEDRAEARELVLPISTFQPAHEGTSAMNVSDQSCDNSGHLEQLPVLEEEPTPKEHRKPTYGKGLNKLTKSMGHKLQPTFVQGKKRPEQPLQAAKLASESGIVNRLEIDVDDPTTRDVCSDLLKSGVRQQRYRLKRKYFNGVPENEVLSNKPPGVSEVDWVKLVKKWSTPRDQETSKINKQNRKEVRLHQTTGSRSYIAQRFSMKVNGVEADSIDLFKSSHYSKNKDYSDLAQEAIDAMETARDQAVDEGEEPKSTNEIEEIDGLKKQVEEAKEANKKNEEQ
ncbi:LOW QUALITY PROTEIN: hypothetical protein U9M48_006912, partial [Paspalum notatum var. saurae]